MDGSGSGGGKLFGRFTEPAHRVLDLAREEAERCGHRYLGPEHVLLGVLAEGQSGTARALRAHGLDLVAARAALARLAERGVVPAPRPSDAELLRSLGIDLDAVRRDTDPRHTIINIEQLFEIFQVKVGRVFDKANLLRVRFSLKTRTRIGDAK